MDHSTLFHLHIWLKSRRKVFQSRIVIVLLLIVNYGNSVILTLEAFGSKSHLTFLIFLFNSFIVICALYGIYSYKLVFLTPNVILKISLSSAALFYGLQMAETSDYSSVFHLLWILFSVCLFIWEIHAMFSATFFILKELNHKANLKPPPSYNQIVVEEVSPPTYQEALKNCHYSPVVLNVEALDKLKIDTIQVV